LSAKDYIALQAKKCLYLFQIGFFFKHTGVGSGKKIFFYGIFLTLLFLILQINNFHFLSFFENRLYDTMLGAIDHQVSAKPVIVDIDEKSLKELGQWPWPRYQMAKLFKKISEADAASIGVDILFSEPDRTSLNQVRQELSSEFSIDLNLDNIPHHLRDNDIYLADTFAQGPFILGYKFIFSDGANIPKSPIPLNIVLLKTEGSKSLHADLYMAKGAIEPLPLFTKVMGGAGFVNVRPDVDGVIRRIPLLIEHKDRIYPSLALASIMKAMNIEKSVLKISDTGAKILYLDKTQIPLDTKGNLLIRYRGKKRSFDYISAIDLLNGDVDTKKIAGRIVFVGTSATGLKDSYTTPLDTLCPGVEIHANVADNILNNLFLSRPAWSKGVEILITLGSGILVSLVLASATPLVSLLFPGICLLSLWFGALEIFKTGNMFFSPLYPLITVAGCFAFLNLLRFRMAEKKAHKRAREIQRIESELNIAKEIQMGVIPKIFPAFPDQDSFDLFASLIPAREVGGDLYDFFLMDEDHLCFTIGDVAGKGVPASLFMVITRTLIKNLVKYYSSPADLMARINEILCIDNPRSLFVTLFIGILDLKTGKLIYANGGHNPPVQFSDNDGVYFNNESSGPVVGVIEDLSYEELTLTLKPGDAIFLYTDGVTEAMNKNKREFSATYLLKICKTIEKESTSHVVKTILQKVRNHAGTIRQSDDIAMMMIRFLKKKRG
jgi:adenylate cyclase